jgi:ABC-2 type transport system permease protein
MKKSLIVAWREYTENIKTKGFWFGMLALPIMLFLSTRVPMLLEERGTPTRHFILVDQSGRFEPIVVAGLETSRRRQVLEALNDYARKNAAIGPSLASTNAMASPLAEFGEINPRVLEAFASEGGEAAYLKRVGPFLREGAPPFKEPRRLFERVGLPPGIRADADLAALSGELRPYFKGERQLVADGGPVELFAAVLIPKDIESRVVRPRSGSPRVPGGAGGVEFWSANVAEDKGPARPGTRLQDEIEQIMNRDIRRREYAARGMDEAAIGQIEQTYAPFVTLDPKKEGREAVGSGDVLRVWAPSGFVYLLWVAIFSIIQMLLGNMVEEKSNRTIEVLLSSVTPHELMMGKLVGIAAVGLTLVFGWVTAMVGILEWSADGGPGFASQILTALKSSRLIPMFSLYFLLGYVFYGSLILSLGSVCNTLKEAQNYVAFITMLMMVPLLTMTFIPKDPNGVLARVLSWIPLYTPFTMMNRALADPPMVDLVGTMVLMLFSTAGSLWMAGKIFRVGILRTGQPPRLVEIFRWLRS